MRGEGVAPKLYKVTDLAEMFGVTKITIRAWINDGKIKAVKHGKSYYVTEEDLNAYLQEKHG